MPEELEPLDPEIDLEPLQDVPAWCNDFLNHLADPQHRGVIRAAAHAAGRTWHGVDYWRRHSPAFAARLAQIHETVNQDVDDQIEHRLINAAIDGYTETTTETLPEGEKVTKVKEIYDPKVAQWLLAKRRKQRYGDEQDTMSAGAVVFVFNPEGARGEVEGAAEITAEETSEVDEGPTPDAA